MSESTFPLKVGKKYKIVERFRNFVALQYPDTVVIDNVGGFIGLDGIRYSGIYASWEEVPFVKDEFVWEE